MTFSRSTTVSYSGTIMEGSGNAVAGTGAFSLPVSFPRRIGEPEGTTSPEELIAAAHATCYAMVVTGALGRANASTKQRSVKCTITADKGEAGIKITNSKLELTAEGLTGMDAAAFETMAREAEGKCPVSNLLRPGLTIDLVVTVK
ncbi:MAG TPA: OsmC family peroxiredoxin [Vicinamibacterales bacterium]|nr:OsmC family peroxiredoxin [Vicinamibacterales bacterium]